ncbi:MAG: hypothetical protein NTZ07_03180, partial [Candidatus Woesebacteria bacterium]|nr:hypothetical protein [Candidatus Woesebacteria bacterium]
STGEVISTLKISIITSQPLTGSVRKQIGEKVCDLLEQHGSSYTNIEVSQTKINKVLIFSYDQSFTEGRTCQEWHQNPANNFGPTN